MANLKPCPFCGKKPQITSEERLMPLEGKGGRKWYEERTVYLAECTCCKLIEVFSSEEEAVKGWNHRVPDSDMVLTPPCRIYEPVWEVVTQRDNYEDHPHYHIQDDRIIWG